MLRHCSSPRFALVSVRAPRALTPKPRSLKRFLADAANAPTVAQPASDREVEAAVARLFSSTLQTLARKGLAPPPENAAVPAAAIGASDNAALRNAEVRLRKRLEEIAAVNEHQLRHLIDKYSSSEEHIDSSAWLRPDMPFLAQSLLQSIEREAARLKIQSEAASNIDLQRALQAQEDARLRQAGINPDSLKESRNCLFCGDKRHMFPLEPMNVPLLTRFMNTSGKIMGRSLTGLCKKHQNRLSRTVKWARSLNLITYKHSVFSVNNPFKPVSTHYEPVPVNRFADVADD